MDGIDPRTVCTIPLGEDDEGREIIVRVGRYGPFLQREDTTAPIPNETCPDELTIEFATELLETSAKADEPIGQHPQSNDPIYLKSGRYGPYLQLGDHDPDDKKFKPKMVSLLKGMTPEDVTLDLALQLLNLPRLVGVDDEGVEIRAFNGRYGPYLKRGDDTRSLGPDDNLLTLGRERALELLAQERKGRGFRQPTKPLKVFEKVPALDGADLRLLDGRYGPYVTDGDVNASLPKGADPEKFPLAEALDLLERARERKGKKGGRRKKKTVKKKAAKKAKKKAAKKSPAKKKAKTAKKKTAKKTGKKTAEKGVVKSVEKKESKKKSA